MATRTKINPSHTKGKWNIIKEVNNVRVSADENKESICTVHRQRNEDGLFNHEHQANAQLISASPDMYRALKGALKILESSPVKFNGTILEIKEAISKVEEKI